MFNIFVPFKIFIIVIRFFRGFNILIPFRFFLQINLHFIFITFDYSTIYFCYLYFLIITINPHITRPHLKCFYFYIPGISHFLGRAVLLPGIFPGQIICIHRYTGAAGVGDHLCIIIKDGFMHSFNILKAKFTRFNILPCIME